MILEREEERKRAREKERERERNINVREKHWLPPILTLTEDQTHNLGICPDLELYPQHFGIVPQHFGVMG